MCAAWVLPLMRDLVGCMKNAATRAHRAWHTAGMTLALMFGHVHACILLYLLRSSPSRGFDRAAAMAADNMRGVAPDAKNRTVAARHCRPSGCGQFVAAAQERREADV